MYKIIIAIIVFIISFLVIFQYPSTTLAVVPLAIAWIILLYRFTSMEATILLGIFMVFMFLGIVSRLTIYERYHIIVAAVSLILTILTVYYWDTRYANIARTYNQKIHEYERTKHQHAADTMQHEKAIQSLSMRGVFQNKLDSIVRTLAGTFDPAAIHQHMFTLLKDIIPEGKKYLVPGSEARDIADEWVMRQRVPILSQDTVHDGRFLGKWLNKQVQSLIVAPIIVQGRVQDIVRIEGEKTHMFNLTDLRIVELITLMTSISLGNAQLFEQVKTKALHDGLTGLYAQNYFIEKLQQELLFAQRYHTTSAIMMIDVDHFKKINDTYGHQTGDTVLKHIALIIRETVGPVGCVGRYGGEEFSVLIPQMSRALAKETGSHILSAVADSVFDSTEYRGLRTTVSIGLAVCPEDGTQAQHVLSVADSNLYRAKLSGRNRLVG